MESPVTRSSVPVLMGVIAATSSVVLRVAGDAVYTV